MNKFSEMNKFPNLIGVRSSFKVVTLFANKISYYYAQLTLLILHNQTYDYTNLTLINRPPRKTIIDISMQARHRLLR